MKLYKFVAISLAFLLIGLISLAFLKKKDKSADISSELQDEATNCPLVPSGNIPSWLSGTLMRNGPVKITVNGQSNVHWFDGLAMLHAFSFQEGKVSYSNKFLHTDAYHTVFDEGSLNYDGFAVEPSRSLFTRFLTLFMPSSHLALPNANVNVAKLANEYVALTEIPLPVKFDVKTLDTLGAFDYDDQLPKGNCWESAHPHYDISQKETLNYLIKFGRTSYYTLYRLQEGSSERKIIAEVPIAEPAYMHSFALTKNYVIFTEFPLVVKPLDLITSGRAFIKNFFWHPERGTKFIVVDRHNGNVVGEYITKPFFSFHHANAFEEGDSLHIDIVTYEDASVITAEHLNHNPPSYLERFSLDLKTEEITSTVLFAQSIEFPRINEALDGHDYTYVYAVAEDKEALYKINTTTKELLTWYQEGCSPGEPVFVAAPDAKEEDEGVILAIILDSTHNDSFLLILDGKSFKEIGRAQAPHVIPKGLHGQYFQSVR